MNTVTKGNLNDFQKAFVDQFEKSNNCHRLFGSVIATKASIEKNNEDIKNLGIGGGFRKDLLLSK